MTLIKHTWEEKERKLVCPTCGYSAPITARMEMNPEHDRSCEECGGPCAVERGSTEVWCGEVLNGWGEISTDEVGPFATEAECLEALGFESDEPIPLEDDYYIMWSGGEGRWAARQGHWRSTGSRLRVVRSITERMAACNYFPNVWEDNVLVDVYEEAGELTDEERQCVLDGMFSALTCEESDREILEELTLEDLPRSSIQLLEDGLTQFLERVSGRDVVTYLASLPPERNAADKLWCFGSDFVLTRSGAGTGYWDREYGDPGLGERLTAAAGSGEAYLLREAGTPYVYWS